MRAVLLWIEAVVTLTLGAFVCAFLAYGAVELIVYFLKVMLWK